MVNELSSSCLSRFFSFFEKYGTERLNGLDSSYFDGLSDNERAEAWSYLKKYFYKSEECIHGLNLMDPEKAVELFESALAKPIENSPYPAARQAIENCRLLMLRYVLAQNPKESVVNALVEFSTSEFPGARSSVAQSLPIDKTTAKAVSALKSMIFTETERVPLFSSITKLMAIYGLDYDLEDKTYKSIYLGLRSDDVEEKNSL